MLWCSKLVDRYQCDQCKGNLLLVSSSLNPIVSVEHRRDQNGNGHLTEKPMSLDVMPMNGYDNPVLEEPDIVNRDYMVTPPNG